MLKIPTNYWLILPIALLVTLGQLLAKWRSLTGGYQGSGSELHAFARLVTDPVMIAAYGVGFLANVGWLYVLTKVPLTIGFPVYMGVTFAFVLLGGWAFLGEPLSLAKVVAVLMIMSGVVLALHADAAP
jgi:multidrug transporter EmrE-like cation transporter